jgi:hypothetical protein
MNISKLWIGSTVVEHSNHNPKVQGSYPTKESENGTNLSDSGVVVNRKVSWAEGYKTF